MIRAPARLACGLAALFLLSAPASAREAVPGISEQAASTSTSWHAGFGYTRDLAAAEQSVAELKAQFASALPAGAAQPNLTVRVRRDVFSHGIPAYAAELARAFPNRAEAMAECTRLKEFTKASCGASSAKWVHASLGVYKTEAAARAGLEALKAVGVPGDLLGRFSLYEILGGKPGSGAFIWRSGPFEADRLFPDLCDPINEIVDLTDLHSCGVHGQTGPLLAPSP
ncbi:MAG: hypothetical protein KDA53_05720 [Hyphomonas sp.]|nr:hypothetical protein [Hyphomonas sp.]